MTKKPVKPKTKAKAKAKPKDKEPKSLGRPETYNKEWADSVADKIPKLMSNGESIAEVADKLGISKETFYKCKGISSQFSDAVKRGLTKSESWWMQLGRRGAMCDVEINPTTWIFNVKNRFGMRDTQKEFVPIDFSECKNNYEKTNRLLDLTADGKITIDDAMKYKAIIKTHIDESQVELYERVQKIEAMANGLNKK